MGRRCTRGSALAGQGDPRFLGMGAIEHHGVADNSAERGAAAARQLLGRGLFVRWLAQPDLHELVLVECLVEGAEHGFGDSALADKDDWLGWMREAAQVAALGARERGGGGLGVRTGHGEGSWRVGVERGWGRRRWRCGAHGSPIPLGNVFPSHELPENDRAIAEDIPSLAAIIDERIKIYSKHFVTIEDPSSQSTAAATSSAPTAEWTPAPVASARPRAARSARLDALP